LSNFENNENIESVYEDISSHSPNFVRDTAKKTGKAVKKATDSYGNGAFKNIDKIIKVIAFVLCLSNLAIFAGAAAFLYFFIDKSFLLYSALILLVGIAVSIVILYLVFGLGHIISLNKEILKKLDE